MHDFAKLKGRLIHAFPGVPDGNKAFTLPNHLEELWHAFGAALKLPEQLAERLKAIKADEHLSELGKKAAIGDWAGEHGAPTLRQILAAQRDAESQRAALEATMAGSLIDKTDFAGAMLRKELRDWLRNLRPSERAAMFIGAESIDPQIAAAVVEAPPQLSGVLPEQRDRLTRAAAALRHPEQAKALTELDQAVQAIEEAWQVAREAIQKAAGVGAVHQMESAAGLRSNVLSGSRKERTDAIQERFPELSKEPTT